MSLIAEPFRRASWRRRQDRKIRALADLWREKADTLRVTPALLDQLVADLRSIQWSAGFIEMDHIIVLHSLSALDRTSAPTEAMKILTDAADFYDGLLRR
jgi:hypothetical protein